MGTLTIDGVLLEKLISGGAANLSLNCKVVNDLNVFPIPDGDTGDNMLLTVSSGVRAMEKNHTESVGDAATHLADGMLMGARGNSGVILSQFFAGFAAGLRGLNTASISEVGDALREGVKSAYSSVITPTEGTILTVARESVEYAVAKINAESSFESFNADALDGMMISLRNTPELLPILKEAGVIDSGGAGFYYIAEGIDRTLHGEILCAAEIPKAKSGPDISKFNEDSVMEFGYCTEFLLQLTHAKTNIDLFQLDELIGWLQSVGDSIVAVKNGTIVKVHVHTMTPGAVLEHCQAYGEFLTLKIENMTIQHSEVNIENNFEDKPEKKYAIVTVADGEGIHKMFSEFGADVIIDGGQGKNPSTEQLMSAFDEASAEYIYVLPNNGNVIMAAKQAAELYKRSKVYVIESKNIGDGYSALSMHSFESDDPDAIAEDMRQAMEGVVTGMVSRAIRDTSVDGVEIRAGNYIGFTDKSMKVSCESKTDTAIALCELLDVGSKEFILAILGRNVTEKEAAEFHNYMREHYRRTELWEIDGGQDVFDFMIVLP